MADIALPTSFPSQADPAAVVSGPNVRFTVLTSRLVRMEYRRTNVFEDRASQAFWYRRQPVPGFKTTQTPEQIEIETEHLRLVYRDTDAGLSGDSWVAWATLEFQPFFTTTAANVLCGWWSHDIGGHCSGTEEPELYARWVQLGTFSPILRLHSTKNPFHDRRPWGNGVDAFRVARGAMQLRHMLIPYIYSMVWRMTQEAIPLVTLRPPETNLSRHTVWLPPGDWFHFNTGEYFGGDRTVSVYGTLDDIPVFARAGGIVPLGPRVSWGGVDSPVEMTVYMQVNSTG